MKRISLIALCVVAMLASGCGKEEKVSVPATDIQVTKKGDVITFAMKGKDEKTSVTIAGSDKGVALPDKFPTDVPVMPGAIVKVAMATGEGMSVQFSVKASHADAVKYYEENLKARGWTIEATMKSDPSSMISAKKGKRECVLNIITDAGGSIVQVLVPAEKG